MWSEILLQQRCFILIHLVSTGMGKIEREMTYEDEGNTVPDFKTIAMLGKKSKYLNTTE